MPSSSYFANTARTSLLFPSTDSCFLIFAFL